MLYICISDKELGGSGIKKHNQSEGLQDDEKEKK